MANLVRSAKSGSEWTTNDLLAYNITVSSQPPEIFYGQPLPPTENLNKLDPYLISSTLGTRGLSDETLRILRYLDLASRVDLGQESAVHDFTREILRVLGYEKHALLLSRYAVPLLISCDPYQSAQTGICLTQGSSSILLVVQPTVSIRDPDPQVVAIAIATFQCNNRTRARLGETELDSMTIPCIATIGTRPIFYLVPVTRELSEAVVTAQYPHSSTIVKKCVIHSDSCCLNKGMETPDFRQVAFQHYTAFLALAEAHWSAFMIPMETGP
jgi:hypothetical protein